MSNNTTCNICCNNYTDTVREKISCFNCDFASCKVCIKTYLEEQVSNLKENHCMNCMVAWDGNFIVQNINSTFYKKIEKIEFNNYFDREKSLLQSTQPLVQARIRRKKILEEISELRKERSRLKQQLDEIKRNILRKERQIYYGNEEEKEEKEEEEEEKKINYICKCPSEDCRGFVNSRNHKCGICSKEICKDCQTLLEDEHKCDQNIIDSVKLLKKDSKQCPSCHTTIFKTEGCDQMFCTQCNTAFSWTRGTIETGPIHNPHYFEWQRRTGTINRNPHDIQCGGLPPLSSIPISLKLDKIYQTISHITHVEIYTYDSQPLLGNQDLRLQYLMNDITEEKWKHVLAIRFKKSRRNTDILGLLNMIVNATASIFNNIIHHYLSTTKSRTEKINACAEEISSLENLRNYYNDEMQKISRKFNTIVVPFIERQIGVDNVWKIVKSVVKPN